MAVEKTTALSLVGIAGFQILSLWNTNAPNLQEMRKAAAGDETLKQQLYDADFLVGGIAIALGVTFAILTHDVTAMVVMLVMFGMISLWYHMVLNADQV